MIKNIQLLIAILFFSFGATAQNSFVKQKGQQFHINGKPYYFIGTNYWYGGLLALQKDPLKGKQRLIKELDFLKAKGINNLRVLVGSEGEGKINGVDRVKPALQTQHNAFDAELLKGLDFLLMEMAKRKMYAVLFLSNNWEWSGGFLQYLNWNWKIDNETLKRKLTWDEQRDYTSKFYSCDACKIDYQKQVDFIIKHKNFYTGKSYVNESAIMAWELANEPRPMRASATEAYKKWIVTTADYIKSIDKNHLITIGTEGYMGTEEDLDLFKEIHAHQNIDYLTIHIWPKNWGWFKDAPTNDNLPLVIEKTSMYIKQHENTAKQLNKPLVIEEFGLPRDGHDFAPSSKTELRDEYFNNIFSLWANSRKSNGAIAGCNFWAFGGLSRPVKGQLFWKEGDDFSGDPPQEEQGLNAVFDSDKSTWGIVKQYLKK
ncbi:glycoside hydrolase 5 family protein [Pedobacter mendelii]|uniref:mannan endo-1,4-beta-mannosidase n=1 Tax=Pedobacter mendelii TaxID=1908240 RepID=A0ABQ2BFZ5_9SPHI|nr:cellulase family glycosylhydrolase [Pedobacter mendelii]GGI25326.1 endo-1,4-beta-mannosidase [Pedobacter mendelii]